MPGEAEGQFQREVPADGSAESQGQPGGQEQEEEDVTGWIPGTRCLGTLQEAIPMLDSATQGQGTNATNLFVLV